MQNDAFSWLVVGLLTLVTVGELAFAFWLLIRGVNTDAWQLRARPEVAI